jgi:hypothetical protein
MNEEIDLEAGSPVAVEAAAMARALISALAGDDVEVYATLLNEAVGRSFNGLELAGTPSANAMSDRVAWITALVASLATACCISIGVAEAAGITAPDGEGLLAELLTALSAGGVTF